MQLRNRLSPRRVGGAGGPGGRQRLFAAVTAVAVAAVFVVAGTATATARTAANAAKRPAPVLTGAHRKPGSAGFGQVRPGEIYRGGDEAGLACHIHWYAWGGTFALGAGTAWYVAPGATVSRGHWAPAVVVLYRRGSWNHRPAYTRFRWYFPQGGSLSGGRAIDCLT